MSGYPLDTNVVSKTMRRIPHSQVVTCLAKHDDLWLSMIVLHELEYGVQLMESRAAMEWAARFRAQSQRSEYALGLGDALMAGAAKANGLCVATRNVTDFQHLDVDVTNPWVAP